MDSHYDFDGAAAALTTLAEERSKEGGNHLKDINEMDHINPIYNTNPQGWILTVPGEHDSEPEEFVVRLQGVIVQKELPPVTVRPDKRIQTFIRQSVNLTGLGTPSFRECIENIQRLSQLISRQVPEGTMDTFTQGRFLEHTTLDIGTRYFTSRKDDPVGPSTPFDHSVDPKGILASIVDDKYFYGSDNVVQYYSAHLKSPDDGIKFKKVDPVLFRIGDIVEAQITVMGVPVRKGRTKMIIQLRSLALLTGSFAERAATDRTQSKIYKTPTTIRTVKRRIGYDSEEEEAHHVRKKIFNMTMNDAEDI